MIVLTGGTTQKCLGRHHATNPDQVGFGMKIKKNLGRQRGSELGSSPDQAMISNDPLKKERPLPRQSTTNPCS